MGRKIFQFFARIHVFLYRLTGGRVLGKTGIPILLLTTTGRKSGKKRIHPLGYFEADGGYVIIGSNGGSNHHPNWFHNLRDRPQVLVQIKAREFEARAEIAGLETRDRLWKRLLEIAPFYTRYEKRTKRKIPMVILRG